MPESVTQPRPPHKRLRSRRNARLARDSKSILAPYELRNAEAVSSYLAENSDLLPFLAEAPDRIRKVFGHETPVALEVVTYFDSIASKPDLWVMATVPPDVDLAIDGLHKLDREWLVHLPRPMRDKANVDVEFRR